jgi:hypothetical protein
MRAVVRQCSKDASAFIHRHLVEPTLEGIDKIVKKFVTKVQSLVHNNDEGLE